MRAEETSASKPSMNCRKRRDDVKTKGESLTWEKSERYLLTAQVASGRRDGVNSVQALVWKCAKNLARGCCTGDGGRPTVIGLQERVTNRRMLLNGRPDGSERFG